MAKNQNFKNNYRKNSISKNVFRRPKDMILKEELNEEKRNKFILWNTFYRRCPWRFVETYLGIKLFPYQIIWLYLMSVSDVFVGICSRAAGKSYLVAVFGVVQCILYPGSELVIGASTVKQASLIITNKVKQLRDQSSMLDREIDTVTANPNLCQVTFINGSSMTVVAANEGGKGNRSTLLRNKIGVYISNNINYYWAKSVKSKLFYSMTIPR